MSYYIDPWLFNCANNPADTPAQQQEQRTIIAATERALNYARSHGVTLVSALGNENTDIGHPTFDDTSPDYPPDAAYPRDVDNSCVDMPTEAPGVLGISALGPTKRKAYYSNYGVEQTDLSAPGGDRRDFFGTPQYGAPDTRILAPYPKVVAEANGDLNPDGTPNNPLVLEDCSKGECAYYQYLQGTSMASPHAVGVAAVVVGSRRQPRPHERRAGDVAARGRAGAERDGDQARLPEPAARTTIPIRTSTPRTTPSARARSGSTASTATGSWTRWARRGQLAASGKMLAKIAGSRIGSATEPLLAPEGSFACRLASAVCRTSSPSSPPCAPPRSRQRRRARRSRSHTDNDPADIGGRDRRGPEPGRGAARLPFTPVDTGIVANAVESGGALDGFPTNGDTFAILTSGDPTLANANNDFEDSGRDNFGDPGITNDGGHLRGDTDFDVSVVGVGVDVPVGANCLALDYRFLSDEFPEFVGTVQRRLYRGGRQLDLDHQRERRSRRPTTSRPTPAGRA